MKTVTVTRRVPNEEAINAISQNLAGLGSPARQSEFAGKYYHHIRRREYMEPVMACDFARVVEGAFVWARGRVEFLKIVGDDSTAQKLAKQMKLTADEVRSWLDEKLQDHNGRKKPLWDVTEPIRRRLDTACAMFE